VLVGNELSFVVVSVVGSVVGKEEIVGIIVNAGE